jgi:hypothetical protein
MATDFFKAGTPVFQAAKIKAIAEVSPVREWSQGPDGNKKPRPKESTGA